MFPRMFQPEESGEGGQTVRDVVSLYLKHSDTGTRTQEGRVHVLGRFCDAHGDLPLSEAKPFHLQLWIADQAQLKSDWTIKRWIATVKACFSWAVRLQLIDRHPFATVTHRAGKRGRELTQQEFQAMLHQATDGRLKRFLLFLRFTGCRPGEAAGASWSDLDLERGVIMRGDHKTSRKTGESRTIYLTAAALRLLCWIRKNEIRNEAIFVNAWGNRWSNGALSQRLRGIRERAGLPKDAKYYGLRHKMACDAIRRGVELKTLSVLMGHKSVRTTEYYVSIAGDTGHLRSAAEKIFKT